MNSAPKPRPMMATRILSGICWVLLGGKKVEVFMTPPRNSTGRTNQFRFVLGPWSFVIRHSLHLQRTTDQGQRTFWLWFCFAGRHELHHVADLFGLEVLEAFGHHPALG